MEVFKMINLIDLSGKTVLVTGASDGIGKETSTLLSQLGARVVMIARSEEKLQAVYDSLEGDGHSFYSFDLTNIDAIEGLTASLVEQNGPFDGFVHCAGIAPMRPLKMVTYSFLHETMLVNFYSFVEILRCITKRGNYRQGMGVVAMSSIASKQGQRSQMTYCASKAALDGAIRALAKELSDKKIRINSIVAGMVRTNMYEHFKEKTGKNVEDEYLLGIIEPSEISTAIAYLLSDKSKTITGTGMIIDSGATA